MTNATLLFAAVMVVWGIGIPSSGDAGTAGTDRDCPYTVDPETGVEVGMTGRELSISAAGTIANLGRVHPGAALLWKQAAKEPGQYVGIYIFTNGHTVKLYGDTGFLVKLDDGSVIRSEGWHITDDGETQSHLWSSKEALKNGLKLNATWMLSTKRGSVVIAAFYPLGSFRLCDVKEVGVQNITVDGANKDIFASDDVLPSARADGR